MKKTLLLMTLVFGVSYSAWATPAPCVSESLLLYEGLGSTGCTYDGVTFDDFNYIPSASLGAFAPDASGVTVTPVVTAFGSGLFFSGSWTVTSLQAINSTISYDASTSTPEITGLELAMDGGALSTGSAAVDLGSITPPAVSLTVAPGVLTDTDTTTFTPAATSLSLTNSLVLSGGIAGSANIGGVYNLISQSTSPVPEPPLLLLSAAILGLVPIARRKFVR
jgi:hypothetical protein